MVSILVAWFTLFSCRLFAYRYVEASRIRTGVSQPMRQPSRLLRGHDWNHHFSIQHDANTPRIT
ncbi:hypothetical protein PR002_g7144 [Phytophthora rubi]|uniref:Secreted protein n=1 Tax=Phytophthora rubi TaxID=129364 RepID=A0A6A3N3Y8_9STRA|nr:hypothetical protein PR002_g7144 [Phytophthora rubi]